MRHDPFSDAIHFLLAPGITTLVFWALLIASLVIALYALGTRPEQRAPRFVADWLIRLLIGCMWWQQSLWKLPPYYTDQPNEPFGTTGLAYWMGEMAKGAAFPLQSDLVSQVVLPNFYLFAPIVYAAEALTAASLILGLFVRFWGLIGALQILNLWLGLYNAAYEWPWTYFFLLMLQLVFAIHRSGRSLGLDAILSDRLAADRNPTLLRRLFAAAT
jgi:hypothetical protein